MHTIITMASGFSGEVISFNLQLKGKASHTVEPESGINPALAIADIITALAQLNQLTHYWKHLLF